MSDAAIPLIDLASERGCVVAAVREACEDIGFFAVTGHGVPERLIDEMYATSRAFFDLPGSEKRQVSETGQRRGGLMYFPYLAEHLAGTAGEVTPGDLKESLDFGPGFYGDEWPARPAGLERAWHAYFKAMGQLAGTLRRLFALATDLREDYFEASFTHHLSSLRVLNYPDPATPALPGQLRAGAHRDYGVLTILRSEAAPGGLQVQTRDGHWLDVPALEGAFVVNIGDAMMRWTNDHWVSTLHRVVNPPPDAAGSSRRQSMAYFHNPNRDAVISCLPSYLGPGASAKYSAVVYGDYAEERYRQAHGAQKSLWDGGDGGAQDKS